MKSSVTEYLSAIGRKGGKSVSKAKTLAVRRNGKKGGRPVAQKKETR